MVSESVYSVVPAFPFGTTPLAMATVLHRMAAEKSATKIQARLFKLPNGENNRFHFYGLNAIDMAQAVFGSTMCSSTFMRQHTMFGVIERVLGKKCWLVRDEQKLAAGSLRMRESPAALLRLNPHLSWCPRCCQHDCVTFGVPLWKVIHQIPFVKHCLIHRELLQHRCSVCSTVGNDGRALRLPPETCRVCGSQSFAEVDEIRGDAYWRLIERLSFIVLRAGHFDFASVLMNQAWTQVAQQLGSNSAVREYLDHKLKEDWVEDQLWGKIAFNRGYGMSSLVLGTMVCLDAIENLSPTSIGQPTRPKN